MGRANRNFGSDPEIRGDNLAGFAPGGSDFGVVRIVDGHNPYEVGAEGNNVHQPSAGDPGWNDPVGPEVE